MRLEGNRIRLQVMPDEREPDPEWLKAHVARLRTKLGAAGAPVPENVRGVGYRLG